MTTIFRHNQYFNIGEIVTAYITPNDEVGQIPIKFEIVGNPDESIGIRRYLVKEVEPKYFNEPIYIFDIAIED